MAYSLKKFKHFYKLGNQKDECIPVYFISHFCETILEDISKDPGVETSKEKYNFYQMFFDRIMKDKKVFYAFAKITNDKLTFEYYSEINQDKFEKWMSLRSKNTYSSVNKDSIGINI